VRRRRRSPPLPRRFSPLTHRRRAGVSMQAVRFHFDGERLRETQTPSELDMEDGDAIDVSMEQVGGAARP
jgi:small ubiquitin-related modifier